MADERSQNDLVLAPGEFAFILDRTKGNVTVYVGPTKTSLAGTDQPVAFDVEKKRFVDCSIQQAKQAFPLADERSYIVLQNPATGEGEHPTLASSSTSSKLHFGSKINIPGPATFPLWPGQCAVVIPGHQLSSNQYLVVRVYNEKAARDNWKKAVVVKPPKADDKPPTGDPKAPAPEQSPAESVPDLTTGKLLVIKGTDVSFFIPPTGIEVVPEAEEYVRSAVTLERLEFCILLDEDGNKNFVRGPAVVFPKPTETFVERNGRRKFNAIELNENMGLHVKVIADYEDADKKEHKAGEELFITGRDQKIYYPREEHAVVSYGKDQIQYAVAIPAGEGRYVLDKVTGNVLTIKGPSMFLADPRTQVIVRRVLDQRTASLWFPDNDAALEYNAKLEELSLTQERGADFLAEATLRDKGVRAGSFARSLAPQTSRLEDVQEVVGEEMGRRTGFTKPRTITLDTKYDGVVAIDVWPGFAVQVVKKTGEREVVVGPKTRLLEYNETLCKLSLSTGTPKGDAKLVERVYLQVKHNKVSDVVVAETKDLVEVQVRVSYRVNFEGDDPNKWFEVENYVKFLTEHLRSMIRNAVKQHGIQEFNDSAISIVRDSILGKQGADGKRAGRPFTENGMKVYDVEVLDVKIGDEHIADLLVGAQHDAVGQALAMAKKERDLAVTQKTEQVQQEIDDAKAATGKKQRELSLKAIQEQKAIEAAKAEQALAEEKLRDKLAAAGLARLKADQEQRIVIAEKDLAVQTAALSAEAEAFVKKHSAVDPKLIAALVAISDKEIAKVLAEHLPSAAGTYGILGVAGFQNIMKMIEGTPLAKALQDWMDRQKQEARDAGGKT